MMQGSEATLPKTLRFRTRQVFLRHPCRVGRSPCNLPWQEGHRRLAASATRPALIAVVPSLNGTPCCTRGHAPDSLGDDRFKEGAGLLPGPIVDVEDPLPPEQEAGQHLRVHAPVLQQPPGTDLVDGRHGLRLQDARILQTRLVQRRQPHLLRVRVHQQSPHFHAISQTLLRPMNTARILR